jgi:hypothetical protein
MRSSHNANYFTNKYTEFQLSTCFIKLRGLSPRANYTDRETAVCRRSKCQLCADIGCHVVTGTDPYGRILGFLDRSRFFFIQVAPQLYSRG